MPSKQTCDFCEDKFEEKNLTSIEGELCCPDCFSEKFIYCHKCDEIIPLDHAVYWNGEYWCNQCLDEITFVCEDCEERFFHDDSCIGSDDCLYCSGCIDNHTDNDRFPEITIPFQKSPSQAFKINKHRNFCGVEIECLNNEMEDACFDYDELTKFGFSQIDDRSLKEGVGVEFVSNAFNGDLLLQKIEQFCDELNNRSYYTDKTCGLHLHIGAPNRINFLKKVFVFYFKYEEFFFRMLPESRLDNQYCKSLRRSLSHITPQVIENCITSSDFQKLFYEVKSGDTLKRMKKEKYNGKRYNWLNLHSLFYRGTIEIRSHSGTVNAEKIKNWILIHLAILNFLKHLSFQTICELPETDGFFLSLFDKRLQEYISQRWQKFNPSLLEVKC